MGHAGDSFVYRSYVSNSEPPRGWGGGVCLGCVVVCVTWLFWSFPFLNAMICSSPAYSRKKSIDEVCSFFFFSYSFLNQFFILLIQMHAAVGLSF